MCLRECFDRTMEKAEDLKPVLPKIGQLLIEDSQELIMCKPRLIPLRSFTLEKLDKMQKETLRHQTANSADKKEQ